MLILALLAFFGSMVAVFQLRRRFKSHAQNYASDKVQRFHEGAVPRLGGAGMFVGWLLGLVAAFGLPKLGYFTGVQLDQRTLVGVVLVVSLAVAVGSVEDVTQSVSVRWRLLLTGLSGCLCVGLLGASVTRLGIPGLDPWWSSVPAMGMMLAVLGVMGLTHAFNLIDGYNGLAGFVAVMISLALGHISLQVGDRQLAALSTCLAASTLGFLFWNYPRGLIFAGDGGAYLWGSAIACLSILLVQRHAQVSPWFVVLLLIYPVWETLFSAYRKAVRGYSPGTADALHLHQLIYRRLVKTLFEDQDVRDLLTRNNMTTPYLLALALFSVAPAVIFWSNTPVLVAFTILFVLMYVAAYLMIVRFKTPRWMRY